MTAAQERIDTRIPGAVLITASMLAMLVMAHHPLPGGGDFAAWATALDRLGPVNEVVHGAMIALVVVLTWALMSFSIRRGVHRSLVTLGLVTWAIGAGSMIVAPILNGFVVTDIARQAIVSPESADALRVALQAILAADRVIAAIGVLGISAAIVCWSADLTAAGGRARWAGVFGLAAGVTPLLGGLLTAVLNLNIASVVLLLVGWSAWFVTIGALMVQRKL